MPRFNLSWLYVIIAMSFAILYFSNQEGGIDKQITYTEFKDMINKGYANKIIAYDDNTVEMYIKPEFVKDVFKNDYKKVGRNPALNVEIGSMESLDKFMEKAQEEGHFTGSISYEKKRDYFGALFWNIAPFLLLIGIWMFAMRRMSGGAGAGGANPFNVGKSKAQVYEKGDKTNRITFKDVAGQAEAKQEVEEIVEFLKQPQKYTELGGKIPKGALLVGPPGTGKTLLAKAVAGEADVPFFSLSGSDFVEMFVGVGASRVRDLFRQAKEKAPCIIFIDEIDAVGRARGKNPSMGGNDERENTLNQLLTEMDGFGSNSGVIILAATNRADILDKALLRAGRFDRQIHVDLPDLNERKEVFGVHLRPIKIDDTVDVDLLARQTPGFSGADIANVCNEAALIAARHGKKFVGKQDFLDAVDRIIGGLEKKTKIYQASTSELFGLVQEVPQKETTPFYPRSPYGVAKQYGFWITKNYRESYGMFAVNGILFNHESERRGETFVTRKITLAAARIAQGFQDKLYLGNLNSLRDWGYAKDYVECMWLILQHDTPEDFVIATGEYHTVREFATLAFKEAGIDLRWEGEGVNEKGIDTATGKVLVEVDPKYFRPAEVEQLLGDPTKAKTLLGWNPRKTSFEELVKIMVKHDMKFVKKLHLKASC